MGTPPIPTLCSCQKCSGRVILLLLVSRTLIVAAPSNRFLSPITTYSGQATTKKGVNQSSHAIVYSDNTPPEKLPGETHMNKDPLHIIVDNPSHKLDPKSRINLSKMMSIDHNVKVKSIGVVNPRSLPKLKHYVTTIQNA